MHHRFLAFIATPLLLLAAAKPAAAEAPPAAILARSGPLAANVLAAMAPLRLPTGMISARCLARPRCVKKQAVSHKADVLAVVTARSAADGTATALVELFAGRTGEPTRSVNVFAGKLDRVLATARKRTAELLDVDSAADAADTAPGAAAKLPTQRMPALVVDLDPKSAGTGSADTRPEKAAGAAVAGTLGARSPATPPTGDAPRLGGGLQNLVFMLIVFGVLTSGFSLSLLHARGQRRHSAALIEKTRADGADQPPSLHPIIDASRCIGCGSCVMTCPDRKVLGIVENQARLLTPANCVGIAECEAICPVDAIKLVFGTTERPIDLPRLNHRNQSTVPGLYIAGELAGMGLIANAFEQAVEIVEAIDDDLKNASGAYDADAVDLLIVGAGPAGIGAALRAKELGLRYRCVDQGIWGGAIRAYPRGKLVMTRPIKAPLFGPVKMRETSKEALVELLTRIVNDTGIVIESETGVEKIERRAAGFVVRTSKGPIAARRVLLAIGRRGSPRKLGVTGECDERVAYSMVEPDEWAGKALVVVGGGDVACETALALGEQPGTTVHLLYRGKSLNRPKPGNRERITQAVAEGRLVLVLEVTVEAVSPSGIVLSTPKRGRHEIAADKIFACLGGDPPTKFLAAMGVEVKTFTGQPIAA